MVDLLLELTRRYTEPHRHYHGLPHIAAMLDRGRGFPLCGWADAAIAAVQRIVLDTKRHEPSSPRSAPVLDLDLMSLAAPWPEFVANTLAIRREYAHVADADFTAGRRAFFATMLQRPRLYFTPFGETLEAAARANLQRAVAG